MTEESTAPNKELKLIEYDIQKELAEFLKNAKPTTIIYNEIHCSMPLLAFNMLTENLNLENVHFNLFVKPKSEK